MQYIFENTKQTIFLTCAFAVLILCLTSATFVRADQTLGTVAVGSTPNSVAVNPVTNRAYIANQNSSNVTVVDGANNSVVATVAVGTSPFALAVNTETNRIYVANFDSNNITVINGADNSTTTVNIGSVPFEIAVNPNTNRIYVAGPGGVNVINGADNSIITTIPGSYFSVSVNPVTNRIYAARESGGVRVINGADNTTTNFVTSDQTIKVAVNPATNKIYVAGIVLAQVDGAISQNRLFVETDNPPRDIVFNTQTDQVFVPIPDSNTVTVLTTNTTVAAPLNTTVAPSGFTNNTTASRMPTFNLTANSTNTLAPRNIYYQFDTKQGDWRRAAATGNTATTLTATATAPFLYNGLHTIYFFATDGTDSTSINPSRFENDAPNLSKTAFDSGGLAPEASSITGQIGSYQFLVAAPLSPTAATVTVGGRVITPAGRSLSNAVVILTDESGSARSVKSTSFGFYRFTDVTAGQTYIVSVKSKRYEFTPQVVSVSEELTDLNLTASSDKQPSK